MYNMVIRQQTGPACHTSVIQIFDLKVTWKAFLVRPYFADLICPKCWTKFCVMYSKLVSQLQILKMTEKLIFEASNLHGLDISTQFSFTMYMLPMKWIYNTQLISCGSKRAHFCGILRYTEKKLIIPCLNSLLGRICRWHFTFELVIVSPTGLRTRTNICSPSL